MLDILQAMYTDNGPERVGVIVNEVVVELTNINPNPNDGGSLSDEDIMKLIDADATWHTHPGQDSTPSMDDYESFMSWPKLSHYIIGKDGVSMYRVENGILINGFEADNSSRVS